MAETSGMKTSYGDTTPQKRAIADLIDMIDPSEVPFVKYFGLDGDAGKFRIVNWPSTKVEWMQDEMLSLTSALAASATSDTTEVSVTAGTGDRFRDGLVILVDLEYMWVSGVSTDTLTVTRDIGGTQATHAASAAVEVISNARVEGHASTDGTWVDISAPYNYTEIFQDEVKVSRTQRRIQQYGIADEFDYQIAKKFKEQLRLVNKAVYRGQGSAGSASAPRMWYGLKALVTTNTLANSGNALTQELLEDYVQAAWEYGGAPKSIWCSGHNKRKISSFYQGYVRTSRDEKRGGVTISEVETEFGVMAVVLDRWCPKDEVYILDDEFVGFLAFDPFKYEPLAKDGDYDKGQVIGEYTFVCKNEKAHAVISSLATT